jgi:hypothetical protein
MKNINRFMLLGLFAVSGLTYATCEDIASSCHQALQLDLAACTRNYSGQQQQDCINRANQQFNNCYSGHGCN